MERLAIKLHEHEGSGKREFKEQISKAIRRAFLSDSIDHEKGHVRK